MSNPTRDMCQKHSETLQSESFLSRWSRVKREVAAGAVPPGTVAVAEPAVLPTLESLAAQGLEADYSVFMQGAVEEVVKRAAIQQLFKAPIFNVMDGLDVYIEDFNVFEPLLASEVSGLSHAVDMLNAEMGKKVEAVMSADALEATETQSQVAKTAEVDDAA